MLATHIYSKPPDVDNENDKILVKMVYRSINKQIPRKSKHQSEYLYVEYTLFVNMYSEVDIKITYQASTITQLDRGGTLSWYERRPAKYGS